MPDEQIINSYEDTIEYLYSLQNFGIKLGLTSISALLKCLGSPHRAYKTIHIAGTNGKGSTAAVIEALLIEAGYSTGLYTSPHLVDFKERFRVNGKEIDEESVTRITKRVRAAKDELGIDIEITFFEYTTALAFCYFMEEEVDIAIIEVGMGGRLDATNVLSPAVSIITNISKEHEQYLGETIEDIAFEKAGIIKEHTPVIVSATDERAQKVIGEVAAERHATLFKLGSDYGYSVTGRDKFDHRGINATYNGLQKNLAGAHQFDNFSTALCALEVAEAAGVSVTEEQIRAGLKKVSWPGRFEVVSDDPIIILDGAHNTASMAAAVRTLTEEYPGKRVITVLGVMKDKDITQIVNSIDTVSATVILTRPEIDRAVSPDELIGRFSKGKDVMTTENVPDAIRLAKERCSDGALIFVTGSLFTVGDAKKFFKGKNR